MFAAFFYCEIDGSSLCLQCDVVVHVGGKRMHKRYLRLGQRVEVLILHETLKSLKNLEHI